MVKLNKKGVSLVEVIVSIALTSVVLIFLMNLFVNIRGMYTRSKVQADYDMLVSVFTKSIGEDIDKYGLLNVEYKSDVTDGSEVIFTFNSYRPTKLSEKIRKVLKVTLNNRGNYQISYIYDEDISDNIVSNERITNVVREVPSDAEVDYDQKIKIIDVAGVGLEVKVPIYNSKGNNYTINIYGLLDEDIE